MPEPDFIPDDLVDVTPAQTAEAIPNDLVDVPQEDVSTYIQDRGQTISVPQTFDGRELEYSMRTQLDGVAKSGFWGMQDLGGQDFMKGMVKGLAHFAISIPTAFGALMKEQGEVMPLDDKPYEMALPPALFDRGAREISRQVARNTILDEKMTEWGQKLIDWNKNFIDRMNIKPTEGQKFAFDIGAATGSVATSIGLGYLTKNPAVMAVVFGELQKASLYEEARAAGKDPRNASNISTVGGLAEGALEFIGTSVFFKAVKMDKLLNRTLVRIAEEAIQEGTQTYAEIDITNLAGVRKTALIDAVKDVGYSMLLGAIAAAPVSTASGIYEKKTIKQRLIDAGMSDRGADRGADIIIATMEEKTAKDPELHKEMDGIISKEASQMSLTNEERDKNAAEVLRLSQKVQGEEETEPQKKTKVSPAKKRTFEQKFNKATEEKLSKLMDQADELARTKVQLEAVKEMTDPYKHRLDATKSANLSPETMSRIPTVFKTQDGGIALDVMLAEINDRFPALTLGSVDDLVDFLEQSYAKEKQLKSKVKELQPKYERREQLSLLKEKLQNLKQGFREGKRAGRDEKKVAQETALDLIQKSGLDPENKAKFLTALKNTDANNLEDFIDEFDRRASALELAAEVRDTKQTIRDLISGTKSKLKFTPEIQDIFDFARKALTLNQEQAQDELIARLDKLAPGEVPSPEDAAKNQILQMVGGLDNKNLNELHDIKAKLEDLLGASKTIRGLQLLQKKERQKMLKEMAVSVITGKRPVDPRAELNPLKQKLGQAVRGVLSSQSGWPDIQDILSQDYTSTEFASPLSESMDVAAAENEEKRGVLEAVAIVMQDQMAAYEVKSERELFNILQQNEVKKDLGTFTFATKEVKPLIMSKAEAISRWMQFQDPTLEETFNDDSVGKMGYTPEIRKAITDFLTPQDIANAQAMMAFYKEFRHLIDVAYLERMGLHLPDNPKYSPISREVDMEPADFFIDEMRTRLRIMPKGTKERVRNTHPLRQESAQKVLMRHIAQMTHFIAWANKIDDINAVYKDNQVRSIIRGKFGQGMIDIIDRQIRHFIQGGIDKGSKVDRYADILRQNYSVAMIGGKLKTGVLQATGFLTFAAEMPLADYFAGIRDYFRNPKEKRKILDSTPFMQDRKGGPDRDLKEAMSSTVLRDFAAKYDNPLTRKLVSLEMPFKQMWLLANSWGDAKAIYVGGWAAYKYAYDRSQQTDPDLRHEEAALHFAKVASKTQQSGDLSQQSDWQRAGGVVRLATQFVSQQNQYMRQEVAAIRNLLKGRIDPKTAAKKLFIYHILLPQLAQLLANGGVWDDDDKKDQLRALIMGSFNGVFILNDIMDALLRTSLDQSNYGGSAITAPVLSMFDSLLKAHEKLSYDEILVSDVLDAVKELSGGFAGPISGIGVKQLFNYYDAVYSITQGQLAKGAVLLAGWGPSVADKISAARGE